MHGKVKINFLNIFDEEKRALHTIRTAKLIGL